MGEEQLTSHGRWLYMEKVWTENDHEYKIPQVYIILQFQTTEVRFSLYRVFSYDLILIQYNSILVINMCRSYYRCTHKYDQGCPATRQVQRIQEDPPLYRTTYYGHHNCKISLGPEIILEPASSSDSSMFLSFSTTFPTKEEYQFSSSLFSSTKQEPMEGIPDDCGMHNQLPSSDYHLLDDYELDFNCLRYDTMQSMLSSTESVQFDKVYGSGMDFDG